MGLIMCPTHGESGFAMRFSKVVVDSIISNVKIDESELVVFTINIIDDEDGELLLSDQYLILKKEFKKMNLGEVVDASSEAVYDSYSEVLPELSGVCSKCLADYKVRYDLKLLDFN